MKKHEKESCLIKTQPCHHQEMDSTEFLQTSLLYLEVQEILTLILKFFLITKHITDYIIYHLQLKKLCKVFD